MMALVTVSAIFLRWLPHHGLPILLLFAVAVGTAAGIYLTQRRRYSTSSLGISREGIDADITAVLWTALAAVALGALGIAVVLYPDHDWQAWIITISVQVAFASGQQVMS